MATLPKEDANMIIDLSHEFTIFHMAAEIECICKTITTGPATRRGKMLTTVTPMIFLIIRRKLCLKQIDLSFLQIGKP